MATTNRYIKGLIQVMVLIAGFATAQAAGAQEYDSIAARYKNEHAVIAKYRRHMIVSKEGDKLVARSYVTREKLLIGSGAELLCNADYVFHSDFNKLQDLHATLLLPTDNGYRRVPCTNISDINTDKGNVFFDDSRFAVVSYSGLLKNSVMETKYVIQHTDLNMLPPFYFQDDLPIAEAIFEVTAPKYVDLSFILKGLDTGRITRSVKEKNSEVTYTFTAKDIPAYKVYDDVPSAMYYLPHVIPSVQSYKMSGQDKKVTLCSDADHLYQYLYKYIRNVNLRDDTAMDRTVDMLTAQDKTDGERAAHIYRWVQANMHYIAFEQGMEGFIPREASTVLTRKYGDCKDMTSILVAMCRRAGLKAYYAWIGTREKPYTYEEVPMPLASNHMICAIRMGEDWVFADGTHPYIPFGKVPEGIQGKEALIAIDGQSYKIVNVPVSAAEQNNTTDSTMVAFSDTKLQGRLKIQYSGYPAWSLGLKMMYRKNDEWKKSLDALTRRGSNKFVLTRNVVNTGLTPDKSATVEGDFTVDNYVRRAGMQYFVNMNLQRTFAGRMIDTDGRRVPVFYDYRQHITEVVVLQVPKGMKVKHVPDSAAGGVDGLWNYKIHYAVKKDAIVQTSEYTWSGMECTPGQFAGNNRAIADLRKTYNESVVLTAK